MAHFSRIDENNIVTAVLAVPDSEQDRGNDYLNETGNEGNWIQTSCNTKGGVHILGGVPVRKNYGIPGYIYNPTADAFHAPQPYPSWTLNQDTFEWDPPIAWPENTGIEYWDEPNQRWINI